MKILQTIKQHWVITIFIALGVFYLGFTLPSVGKAINNTKDNETNRVQNKDVYYEVTSTKELSEIKGPVSTLHTDNKFVVLTVHAVNQNNKAIQLTTDMFRLVDDQKREYEVHTKGNFFMNQDLSFFMQELSPGLDESGTLVFEVPKDANHLRLEIISKSVFKNSVKEIPLEL